MNEPIDDRLHNLADDVDPARPALGSLHARSTRRRRRHQVVGLAVGGLAVCTALLVLPTDEDHAAELDVVGSTTVPISTAEEEVAVPDLRGRSIAEAQALAASLGFEVVANENDDPSWDATVVAQEPGGEGGTVRVPIGSTIGVRTIAGTSTVWDCPAEQEFRRMLGMGLTAGPAPTEVPPDIHLDTVRRLVDEDRDEIADHFGADAVLVGRRPWVELAAPSGDELRDDAYHVLVVVDAVGDCPTTRGEPIESRKMWEETPVWAVYRRPAEEIKTVMDAYVSDPEPATFDLPERGGHSVTWTGEEVVVLGGATSGVPTPTNAAFDPERGTWRSLPPSPRSRTGGLAFWTGTEVLVLGGSSSDELGPSGIDALDPATGAWRTLDEPTVPAGFGSGVVDAVWTGDRLIVWPSDEPAAIAIDPGGERWTELPPLDLGTDDVALHWTGGHLLVLGRRGQEIVGAVLELDGPGRTIGDSIDGASWRRIEPLAAPMGESGSSDTSTWQSVTTGGQIVLWATSGAGASAAILDPTSRTWTTIEAPPIAGCVGLQLTVFPTGAPLRALVALGDAVLAANGCGSFALLMPDQQRWSAGAANKVRDLPTATLLEREAEIAIGGDSAWLYSGDLEVSAYGHRGTPTMIVLHPVPTS